MTVTLEKINELIKPYVEKSNLYPDLCHVYAMLADNIIRKESGGLINITYTKNGYLVKSGDEWSNHKNHLTQKELIGSVISQDEGSLDYDYINTKIKYTNSINACYTNKFLKNESIWTYFLNKYLILHNKFIKIDKSKSNIRFLSIQPIRGASKCHNNHIKVSIIMCAYNAQETLPVAIESILSQTHSNLQLIIVNDKSSDETSRVIDEYAASDSRIKVIHNSKNVGAYVCRNIALNNVDGEYFTCHDADDIAMPTRIENQLKIIMDEDSTSSICLMLRISPDGEITRKTRPTSNSPDGYAKLCHISGMHNTEFFRKNFGYWDSVRVGGDSELLNRIKKSKKIKILITDTIEYLALDSESSATRDVDVGLFSLKGISVRDQYKNSWLEWHEKTTDTYLEFPQKNRKFFAPLEILNK